MFKALSVSFEKLCCFTGGDGLNRVIIETTLNHVYCVLIIFSYQMQNIAEGHALQSVQFKSYRQCLYFNYCE